MSLPTVLARKKQRSDIAYAIKLQITFFTNLVVLCGPVEPFYCHNTCAVATSEGKTFFKAPMTLCGFFCRRPLQVKEGEGSSCGLLCKDGFFPFL